MAQPLGLSFAPTDDNAQIAGKTAGTTPSFARPLQTLNFKLPSVSPHGVSPLQSQTRVGSGIGDAVLQSVMKTVLGTSDLSSLPSYQPSSVGAPMRDPGENFLQQFGSPAQMPESRPTFPSSAPQPDQAPSFEGHIDTPPMQNAPSFGPQFDESGGAGSMSMPNAWEAMTWDDERRRQYLDSVAQQGWTPPTPQRRTPDPHLSVQNPPTSGAGRA